MESCLPGPRRYGIIPTGVLAGVSRDPLHIPSGSVLRLSGHLARRGRAHADAFPASRGLNRQTF